MSAYMLDDIDISRIACAIHAIHSISSSVFLDAEPEAFAQELFDMNKDAIHARYGEDVEHEFKFTPDFGVTPTNLYWSIRSLLYQCSEGSVPETPLFIALDTYKDQLANYIVSKYHPGRWA